MKETGVSEALIVKVKTATGLEEHQYATRLEAVTDILKRFKGRDLELVYTGENGKLRSEFFSVNKWGQLVPKEPAQAGLF